MCREKVYQLLDASLLAYGYFHPSLSCGQKKSLQDSLAVTDHISANGTPPDWGRLKRTRRRSAGCNLSADINHNIDSDIMITLILNYLSNLNRI